MFINYITNFRRKIYNILKKLFRNTSIVENSQTGAQTGAQSKSDIIIDELKEKVLKYCDIPKSSREIREYI